MTSAATVTARSSAITFGTRAPNILVNGTAVVLAGFALFRGSERTGDIGSIAVIGFAWMVFLLLWLGWFVAGVGHHAIAWSRPTTVARWLFVPAIFLAMWVVVFSGMAFVARFSVSRPALEATAEAARSVPQTAGSIGLYDIKAIEIGDGGTRLWVSDTVAFVRMDGSGVTDPSSVLLTPIDDDWSIEYHGFLD